ncbi:putative sterol carrier protein [Geomicrobium halophilum]|uniref:Putative sterol carrier protein n=1 Tax=Geomicrobium halophilum TaxID=549000 RepID=A0A841Q2R2_9BACL|nr:SCP2 sterol-binding domain-containing protein [Geomicrobium halophilum]MBB6451198.1 putative sterol carrier protein [Geomicrobium halophilum]
MSTQDKMDQLAAKMNENPEHIQDLERRYHFDLKQDGLYGIIFGNGKVEIENNPIPREADCTLKMSEKNFVKLLDGEWNPTTAYMTGQLKVQGEITHALKLYNILKTYQNE